MILHLMGIMLFILLIDMSLSIKIRCRSSGKRNAMVLDAHTRLLHGEQIPVEITAACFDPGYQLLLTGARNGSLKVKKM